MKEDGHQSITSRFSSLVSKSAALLISAYKLMAEEVTRTDDAADPL
jgi:hypothetical protein